MLKTLSSIAALLLAIAYLALGNGLFSTLLSVRSSLQFGSTETTGAIMSSYFLGLVIGVFWCREVIRKVGHIRAFAAFAALLSILPLCHAFVVNPWAWAVFRVIAGLCLSGVFMVAESWINERATNQIRGQVLSIYMITFYLALGSGQFLINLDDTQKVSLFVLVSVLFSVAIIPISLTQSEAPAPVPKISFGVTDLFKLSPLAVVGCAVAGISNAAFYGMGPVFAKEAGLPLSGVSIFMGMTIFGGLVLQWPLGKLSDHFDRRHIIMVLAALIGLTCLGMALMAGVDPMAIYALTAVFGGAAFALHPVCTAHANDFLDAEQRVNAAGGLMVVYGCAAAAGPLIAATVMGFAGAGGLYYCIATVQVMLFGFALYRASSRRTILRVLRRPLVFAPRMTTVIAHVASARNQEPDPASGSDGKDPAGS
ncbi:MFS transporter [Denitrobaculum tricleocarpae]|uniref:MFS transporter n=1 Tax=Denitrobaculum tricleocarpae TaxID=2591009 RepID=A0A545TM42_9PROT|nr:MFS transporter [Denitrobaculum tricleocarpae]TQV78317.1 MFS transporter [Denitrobaculum tricleocarpae]